MIECVAAGENSLNNKPIKATSYAIYIYIYIHVYIYILNILVIFYTVHALYTFTISISNNNFNIVTMYMYNIYVKLTVDNRTTADINYKELYDCKWDPMILMNNRLYTATFNFLQIFWADDGLHRAKLVAII